MRDDLERGSKRLSREKKGPAARAGQKLFKDLQRNLKGPSPMHKYKKRSTIGGYCNSWRWCPVRIRCPYMIPKKRKPSLCHYNQPNHIDMERRMSCLTRRQTYLFVLFVRVSVMEHLGTSVGDGGPPTTEAFPASAFLTARPSLVGRSVRVAERLFLVALPSLNELSFLASCGPSGSER